MKARQWLAIAGVALGAFVFNCSEFMPVGLLTDIGNTFSVSESQTGMILSVYAWFVMIFSVPLMVLCTRINLRPLLLIVLAVFMLGQILTAVAVSYWMLMIARLVVAVSHCIFWSIGVPLCVRLADKEHKPAAVSCFTACGATALVVGMPAGRAIGLLVGWRLSFGIVALLAALLLIYDFFLLPRTENEEAFRFSQIPLLFKNRGLVALFIMTALYSLSYYIGYSYIEPFLLQVAHLSNEVVTMALAVFGIAGITASLCCSKVYPKHRFKVIAAATIGAPTAFFLTAFFAQFSSPELIMVSSIVWGLSGSCVTFVYQGEIVNVSSEEESTVAMAFFSSIFNFGIGCGAFVGGRVVDVMGISQVCTVGGCLGVVNIIFCLFIGLRQIGKYATKL